MAPQKFFLYLLSMLFSTEIGAVELPQPFTTTLYGRQYLVATVETVFDLVRTGDYFKYTMRTKGRVLLVEDELYDCSVMAIRDGQIYAVEHKHTSKRNPDRDAFTRFDWSAGTAEVAIGNGRQARVTGLVWPTWDPISLKFKVMTDLLNGGLDEKQVYRLLEYGQLSEWPLRPEGEDRVNTRFGEIPTVKIARSDGKSYKLWFSPGHRFIPVKIQFSHLTAELITNPAEAHKRTLAESAEAPRC